MDEAPSTLALSLALYLTRSLPPSLILHSLDLRAPYFGSYLSVT